MDTSTIETPASAKSMEYIKIQILTNQRLGLRASGDELVSRLSSMASTASSPAYSRQNFETRMICLSIPAEAPPWR